MTGPIKSIMPITVAEDDGLNRTELRLLILLGGYADENGKSWPSITTMATRLKVSERFVRRSLRNLESRGHIERRPQFKDDGRQTSNAYRFTGRIFTRGGGTGSSGGEDLPVPGGEEPPVPGRGGTPSSPKRPSRNDPIETNIVPLPLENTSGDFNTPAKSRKRPAAENLYDDKTAEEWFDEFWRIIPKRMDSTNNKARSLDRFSKHLKAGVPPAEIIDGARRECDRRGARHEYAYAPQNWLRDKGWESNRADADRQYTEAEIAG